MAFDNLRDSDWELIARTMREDGVPEEQWAAEGRNRADRLSYHYHAQTSGNPLTTFGRAVNTGARDVPAALLEGHANRATETTLGLSALLGPLGQVAGSVATASPLDLDNLWRVGAERLRGSVDPNVRRELQEYSQNEPLEFSKDSANFWASLLGQQIPLTAVAGASNVAGAGAGSALGSMAGPGGAKVGGKLGGLALTYYTMAGTEAGFFKHQLRQAGFDDDIVEQEGDHYGWSAAAIEVPQQLLLLGPWSRALKGAGAKVASRATGRVTTDILVPFLKAAGKESVAAAVSGSEEWTQGGLKNHFLDRAVEAQNAHNESKGLPPMDQTLVDSLKEEGQENLIAGAGMSLFFRGTGNVARGVRQIVGHRRAAALPQQVEKQGDVFFQAVKEGKSIEEITGLRSGKIDPTPVGTAQALEEARRPLTVGEKRDVIEDLPFHSQQQDTTVFTKGSVKTIKRKVVGLKELAESMGIDTEEADRPTLQDAVLERAGVYEEGPLLVEMPESEYQQYVKDRRNNSDETPKLHIVRREGKKFRLEVKTPSINPAQGVDIARGKMVEERLSMLTRSLRTDYGRYLRRLQLSQASADKQTLARLREEGQQEFDMSTEELDAFVEAISEGVEEPVRALSESRMNQAVEDVEVRRRVFDHTVWTALREVVGADKAMAILTDEVGLSVKKGQQTQSGLEGILTRDQYNQYVDFLEGEAKQAYRTIKAQEAARQMTANVEELFMYNRIKLRDGTIIDSTQLPEPGHLPARTTQTALFPAIELLAEKLNMPQLLHWDSQFFQGHKQEKRLLHALKTAELYGWKNVPKALRTGEPRRRMSQYVMFKLHGPSERAAHVRSVNRSLRAKGKKVRATMNPQSFVDMIAESSTLKDTAEIERQANTLVEHYRDFYSWFPKQHLIEPHRAISRYAPIIHKFAEDQDKGDVTLDEWMRQQSRADKEVRQLQASMTPSERSSLLDVVDTVRSWERSGIPVPGRSTPWMEYARIADRTFLEDMSRVTDLMEATDLYTRRAVRRLVFKDMVPGAMALIEQGNRTLKGNDTDRDRFNRVIGNYLESIMGVPDASARGMRRLRLSRAAKNRDESHGLGDSTTMEQMTGIVNLGIKRLNSLGLFPSIEERGQEDIDFSVKDVLEEGIHFFYATSLGLPFNILSPFKNLTQSTLEIPALGLGTWFHGIWALRNPQVRETIKRGDYRPEFLEVEKGDPRSYWNKAMESSMFLYRESDQTNVKTAASGAYVAWERLRPEFEKDARLRHLPTQKIIEILFSGKVPDQLPSAKAVLEDNPGIKSNNKWKGVISKPLALETVERIRKGEADEAKQMFTQYMVNLSQWRYGPGGTPQFMRNSLIRAGSMFLTWPVNYGEYMLRLRTGGMGARYVQAAAVQSFMVMLASVFGYNISRWFFSGPFPEDQWPVGPAAEMAKLMYRIAKNSGTLAAEQLVLGESEDEEELKRAIKREAEDLFEFRIFDRRLKEIFFGEESD